MSAIEVECGECGWSMSLEEDQLGQSVKCPKCKMSFVAERAGAYGLEGDDSSPAEQVFDAPPRATDEASRPKKANKDATASAAGRPETEAERKLRERMEKWADE